MDVVDQLRLRPAPIDAGCVLVAEESQAEDQPHEAQPVQEADLQLLGEAAADELADEGADEDRGDVDDGAGHGGAGEWQEMASLDVLIVGLGAGLFQAMLSPAEAAISKGKKSKTNDIEILNFALTLEYLEAAFYARGDANKAWKNAGSQRFAEITGKH